MLLDATPKLEDLIVKLLADKASATASDIQNRLMEDTQEFTIQAIYKALGLLEASGVIVKNKKKYSLRVSWVLDISHLAKKASLNYKNNSKTHLPKTGRRIIWHFNDLLALNNFWSQILLLAAENTNNRQILTWMPHPWFHLAYSEQEEQYIKSLEITGTKLYLINGGDSFLDHWAEKYWQTNNIEYSSSQSWFHDKFKDQYINVVGDFVLTVKLGDKITQEIDNFYQKIGSFDNLDFSEVFRIFGLKVKASMWLENNPEKAQQYRKRFVDYFGIKLNDSVDQIN